MIKTEGKTRESGRSAIEKKWKQKSESGRRASEKKSESETNTPSDEKV